MLEECVPLPYVAAFSGNEYGNVAEEVCSKFVRYFFDLMHLLEAVILDEDVVVGFVFVSTC